MFWGFLLFFKHPINGQLPRALHCILTFVSTHVITTSSEIEYFCCSGKFGLAPLLTIPTVGYPGSDNRCPDFRRRKLILPVVERHMNRIIPSCASGFLYFSFSELPPEDASTGGVFLVVALHTFYRSFFIRVRFAASSPLGGCQLLATTDKATGFLWTCVRLCWVNI